MSERDHLRVLLVLLLAVPFSSYASSSAKAAVPEQAASIPTYQWQFLSASEKAVVNASIRAMLNQRIRNITLSILDASGVPYTGKLQVTQTSTEFINTAGWSDSNWDDYLAMTPSHSKSLYAPWSDVESVRGQWNFKASDFGYADGVEHGVTDFHIQLGPEVQHPPACCYSIPDWAKAL